MARVWSSACRQVVAPGGVLAADKRGLAVAPVCAGMLAAQQGCHPCCRTAMVQEITGGRGAYAAIECVGGELFAKVRCRRCPCRGHLSSCSAAYACMVAGSSGLGGVHRGRPRTVSTRVGMPSW